MMELRDKARYFQITICWLTDINLIQRDSHHQSQLRDSVPLKKTPIGDITLNKSRIRHMNFTLPGGGDNNSFLLSLNNHHCGAAPSTEGSAGVNEAPAVCCPVHQGFSLPPPPGFCLLARRWHCSGSGSGGSLISLRIHRADRSDKPSTKPVTWPHWSRVSRDLNSWALWL